MDSNSDLEPMSIVGASPCADTQQAGSPLSSSFPMTADPESPSADDFLLGRLAPRRWLIFGGSEES